MRTVPVRQVGNGDAAWVQQVSDAFAMCRTLADIMRWAAARTPPVQIVEIVTQDEYTHDVVLPFGALFLSFDTT